MFEGKIIGIILTSSLLVSAVLGHVLLNTSLGLVKGTTMLSRNGTPFYAFLGLPFAEPPVGELRFAVIKITIPISIFTNLQDINFNVIRGLIRRILFHTPCLGMAYTMQPNMQTFARTCD